MNAAVPAGYVPVRARGAEGFALTAAAPWLEAVLREHGTLRAWVDRHTVTSLPGGRGAARLVEAPLRGPDDRARWVCRTFRRGGAVAALGDRYLRGGEPRPFRELRASVAARGRGVRTPAVVAGATYPSGVFYRADIVTEYVPASRSLADALFAADPDDARGPHLAAAGRLVRALESARVLHADLSAGNVLVPLSVGGGAAWVVDLDRCRILPADGPSPDPAMRRRLERSLAKMGDRGRRPLALAEWEALRSAYNQVP